MILLAWWMACRGDPCDGACLVDELCIDGVCLARTCATSTECPLGFHCSPAGDCEEGCEFDADCGAVESCVAGSCAARACTDTQIDCDYREFCTDGVCVDAGAPYCAPCTEDRDCVLGAVCFADQWCGVDCAEGAQCPAGFDCLPLEHEGAERQICMAACWMMESR